MPSALVSRSIVTQFLQGLADACRRPGRVFLAGETSQVYEGWRERTPCLEYSAESAPEDQEALLEAVRRLQAGLRIAIREETPGAVIPLPRGHETRARYAGRIGALEVYHFDPYSVAFRLVARGDEPDHLAVLTLLRKGWVAPDTLDALLADLLPRFTSQTTQQDPAEFRRKYKGLMQMWRAADGGLAYLPP
jgi:hypothetical protein